MVLIICIKCNSESDMPNRRFKVCNSCCARKRVIHVKKNDEPGVVVRNCFSISDIYFLLRNISEYLTIYDTYNVYQTCKEFKDILGDEKIWLSYIKRDFNFTKPQCEIKAMKYAIGLDTSIICNLCQKIEKCQTECNNYRKKISKTDCIEYYKLTENELLNAKSEYKYNNFYKKYITLYNYKHIKKIICEKYRGFTNFMFFRMNIDNILSLKKKKRLENKEKNEREFREWETLYKTSFDYSTMSNGERCELLDNTLHNNNMVRRSDSRLCKAFINGHVPDKHIDHIIALLKMTSIMFSYSTSVYIEFNESCNPMLPMMMFKNRNNNSYTWDDAVDDTHNTFKKRFISCQTVYYFY